MTDGGAAGLEPDFAESVSGNRGGTQPGSLLAHSMEIHKKE